MGLVPYLCGLIQCDNFEEGGMEMVIANIKFENMPSLLHTVVINLIIYIHTKRKISFTTFGTDARVKESANSFVN